MTPRSINAPPLEAVLFDIDGTLVDSNDLHIAAWRKAFAHFGIEVSYEDIQAQMGKGGDQLIPVFCTAEQIDKFGAELEKLRLDLFVRDYLPQVQPFSGVRELFTRLRADGLRIALATSAKEIELKSHIKTLGIAGLFDEATSADDAEHSKPCPDIFEAALAQFEGVSADSALVIGDTPYDAIAANRAGIETIGVLSGGFPEHTLREAGAIAVYLDIADMLQHYDEWAVTPVSQLP